MYCRLQYVKADNYVGYIDIDMVTTELSTFECWWFNM